jgi:hypothetical protein
MGSPKGYGFWDDQGRRTTVAESLLTLTCLLSRLGNPAAAQSILEQYGLHGDLAGDGRQLTARGSIHKVLARMKSADIESHLTARIESAVPGTRVMHMKATFLDA